jgi:hypothetical protein
VQGEKVTDQWLYVESSHDYSGPVNKAWYYFDTSGEVYSASTGRVRTRSIVGKKYMFDQYGRLLSGLAEIKGKCQKADASGKYDVFEVQSGVFCLIDTFGKVVKGKTVKDGSDTKWTVGAGGTITEKV